MKDNKILYIVGGLALVGVLYYFYTKKNKEQEDTKAPETEPLEASKQAYQDMKKQNESNALRFEGVCGKMPKSFGKEMSKWRACVSEQRKKEKEATNTITSSTTTPASFDGMNDYFDIQSSMTGEITDKMEII